MVMIFTSGNYFESWYVRKGFEDSFLKITDVSQKFRRNWSEGSFVGGKFCRGEVSKIPKFGEIGLREVLEGRKEFLKIRYSLGWENFTEYFSTDYFKGLYVRRG